MLLRIHPDNPSERQIRMVDECLRDGGIVIYPTDTIYGIGCDIFKVKSVEKIAELRGLKPGKTTFSFICHDLSQLSEFTRPIENPIFKVMKANLPGPFTFILNASNNVPRHIQSKRKTVGIRIPDNKIVLEIVRQLGNPIMSTSVHDDDEIIEYTTDPELIYEKFQDKVDIVIDGGYGGNIPSTVVDCTDGGIVVVREGKGELV
ncbi:MAG TPA: L-threonylcarbamoyladenylate synthase [Bacteroidales bacterium]|jgi:tRNA threonylcarbamoyl adenosine modification protein (Sua5/YciO/YrdC/YwlC family)|nr:L-threonylcarbamoyladenylate synthase [Bacteroidales bacterium]